MYFDTGKIEECCGCKACLSICPPAAISFIRDKEGFDYPEINTSKCIGCMLCRKICPMDNINLNNLDNHNNIYAFYSNSDEILKKSTSGGIFTLLSNEILDDGGIIFGCRWNAQMEAIHWVARNREERDLFCGSKYVQSDIGTSFIEVKRYLEKGKKVLFTGTPCQVMGLRSFLGGDESNLFTVDIICHGVPSPGIFKDYIRYLEKKYKKKIVDFKFRDKTLGWSTPSRKIIFADGSVKSDLLQNDGFNILFQTLDAILRPSCYNCPFAGRNRIADITIGDFWGVQEEYPILFNNMGVSVLFLNTKKGKELISGLNYGNHTIQKVTLESVKRRNTPLIKPFVRYSKREVFFDDYNKHGIEYCLNKYCYITLTRRILRKINKSLRILLGI